MEPPGPVPDARDTTRARNEPAMDTLTSCATASAHAAEPIAGTATATTPRWLVIEHTGPWPRKGLPESMRPDLRLAVEAASEAVPGTRVLLARGERAVEPDGPRIWIAHASAMARSIQMVRLGPDQPAGSLDLVARLRGDRNDGEPIESLLLVCTHGQRDRCCARVGMPVYQSLRSIAPDETLRASHLGGHRFAPTLVALPVGAHFGRVGTDDAPALVAAVRAGHRGLARWYRGRTFASRPAQTAMCHLHDVLEEPSLDALVVESEHQQDDTATVHIRHGDRVHRVDLALAPHTVPLIKSCGEAPTAVPGWRVIST